ncbi:MAG: hypothetical protein MI922_04590 [Bacteroidales bacterium]|nr:hypothetical protein [Bacteroidales bacterium]
MKLFKLLIAFTFYIQLGYAGNVISTTLEFLVDSDSLAQLELGYHYGEQIYIYDSLSELKNTYSFSTDHQGVYYLLKNDSIYTHFFISNACHNTSIVFGKDFTIMDGAKETLIYEQIRQNKIPASQLNDSLFINDISKGTGHLFKDYLALSQKPKSPDFNALKDNFKSHSELLKYQLEYYSLHYLDNVKFHNEELLYTPLFMDKVNTFVAKISNQDPIKLSSNIDILLSKARGNDIVFELIFKSLLNRYYNSKSKAEYEYMLLHLIENYISKGIVTIEDPELYNSLKREYALRKKSSLYKKAPNIDLLGYNYLDNNLYSIENEIIIVYFYDYDCATCKKLTPMLVKIANKYEYLDVGLYAVCLGKTISKWNDYIKSAGLQSAYNLYDNTTQQSTPLDYHITNIPVIYVLDENKQIIKKNIKLKELDSYLLSVAIN